MKKFLLTFSKASIVFSCFVICAQELPKILPPNPNAASLAQYVEVPVSLYTGLPNINIPIYSISGGNIGLPISLSYHARGVRVGDLASSYGLGWSLNAGGVVTRQVRGNADDTSQGYFNQNYYDDFFTNPTTRANAYNAEINGIFDRMPDQFIFNFLGYSGKFIYDRDTNIPTPILNTFDDLKIETQFGANNKIEGFIVTDTQGTKYYFGKSSTGVIANESSNTINNYSYSYSGMTSTPGSSPETINSWCLLEIIPSSGKRITFDYEVEYSKAYQKREEVAEKVDNSFQKTAYFSEITAKQQKIKKIEFDQGEIIFNYLTPREDLKANLVGFTTTALSNIIVNNINGKRIKKYDFEYEHTESTVTNNIIPHLNSNAPEAKKRLFLKSIKEQGADNSYLPAYKFTYNPQVLPSRFSTSHDKWGYYNGKNNGHFSVFSEDISEIGGTVIDTVKVQAGLLTKIEYPTGGFSEYKYESNRAEFPDHLLGHIAFTQNNPIEEINVILEKEAVHYDYSQNKYIIPFTIGEGIVSTQITAQVLLEDTDCTINESNNCDYWVRIYEANGSSVHAILHSTMPPNPSSMQITIAPGDYILKVEPTDPFNEDPTDFNNPGFEVVLSWNEYTDNPQEDIIFTGGNRIKKTILTEGNGNVIEKNYEYQYPNRFTSGKVFSLPSYYGYSDVTIGGQTYQQYHHVFYRPANKLTLEQGNHGGYAFVTEYLGDKINNVGKNEYSFTTDYDGGLYYTPSYHLPNDNERLRGKPLQIVNFKNNNGVYEPVRKISNNYINDLEENTLIDRVEKHVSLIVFDNILSLYTGQFDPNTAHNFFKTYNLSSSVVKLGSTEITDYFPNGDLKNLTEYIYNYNDHYQIKRVKTTDSDEEITIKEFIYPQDILSPTTEEIDLANVHRFTPLEIKTFKDLNDDGIGTGTEWLGATKTIYDWDNNVLEPSVIRASKGTETLTDRINFKEYDNDGNILQVSKTDGIDITYIYGYNNTLPVAKIENATYTQVQSYVDNLHTLSNGTNEASLVNELNTLRTNLPDAMVTTYTYDPLIGVTSMTDPRGYTIYYEYDEFNRLKHVKDAEGNILSKNTYNYKDQ